MNGNDFRAARANFSRGRTNKTRIAALGSLQASKRSKDAPNITNMKVARELVTWRGKSIHFHTFFFPSSFLFLTSLTSLTSLSLSFSSSSLSSSSSFPSLTLSLSLYSCSLFFLSFSLFLFLLLPTGAAGLSVSEMAPRIKWKWAIHKVVNRIAVDRTYKSLGHERPEGEDPLLAAWIQGSTTTSSSSSNDSETNVLEPSADEDAAQDAAKSSPAAVSVVGRDWDSWLDNELVILRSKLVKGEIDENAFERRRNLLERRWSENV